MTPFYLVTGFLGSGKTTFLKKVLSDYSSDKRIAIIQNEFASSGIDGKELKLTGSGFRLVEVNNGSVFCVCLMGTFIESLGKLVDEYKPDMIFLESSGLADPVNIIELLQKDGITGKVGLAHIFAIVDAPNFERYIKFLPRFRHQIMIADTVIVNKLDICEDYLSEIRVQIRNMNPFAGIIETAYCKTNLEGLISSGEGISRSNTCRSEDAEGDSIGKTSPEKTFGGRFPSAQNTVNRAATSFIGRKSVGRPDINACVLRTHNELTSGELGLFIKELQKSSPRIKGFMNLKNRKVMAVQTVFNYCDIIEIYGYDGPSELIAFGENLTLRYLMDMLKKHSG